MQLTTRSALAYCQSAVSALAQAWSALLASVPHALYGVSWRLLALFSFWIYSHLSPYRLFFH